MIYFKLAVTLCVVGLLGVLSLYAAGKANSEFLAAFGVALSGLAILGLIATLIAWVWSW